MSDGDPRKGDQQREPWGLWYYFDYSSGCRLLKLERRILGLHGRVWPPNTTKLSVGSLSRHSCDSMVIAEVSVIALATIRSNSIYRDRAGTLFLIYIYSSWDRYSIIVHTIVYILVINLVYIVPSRSELTKPKERSNIWSNTAWSGVSDLQFEWRLLKKSTKKPVFFALSIPTHENRPFLCSALESILVFYDINPPAKVCLSFHLSYPPTPNLIPESDIAYGRPGRNIRPRMPPLTRLQYNLHNSSYRRP